jgi:hypothetical protein
MNIYKLIMNQLLRPTINFNNKNKYNNDELNETKLIIYSMNECWS